MLDIKKIRQNPQLFQSAMLMRGKDISVDELLLQDEERRQLLNQVDEKKAARNAASKKLGIAKKNGVSNPEMLSMMNELRLSGNEIAFLDRRIADLDAAASFLLALPNLPHPSVPIRSDEKDHVEVRRWGNQRYFPWEPKSYFDIGTDLKLLDCETASRVPTARSPVFRGSGARLERALVNFLLNLHCDNGYEEIYSPLMLTSDITSCSNLPPKCAERAGKVSKDYFLLSETEMTITQLYIDTIVDSTVLPIRHCAHTICAPSEAGTADFDMHMPRQRHPFDTIELFKIVNPDLSYDELESMTGSVEKALQQLGLPYRVVLLCAGNMPFSAAKTYAVEVWMPSKQRYVELSRCSNCEDFQAHRFGIRFRNAPKEKPQYAHTLIGTGMDANQTIAAILENYQNEDGTVAVPQVLIPYMGIDTI